MSNAELNLIDDINRSTSVPMAEEQVVEFLDEVRRKGVRDYWGGWLLRPTICEAKMPRRPTRPAETKYIDGVAYTGLTRTEAALVAVENDNRKFWKKPPLSDREAMRYLRSKRGYLDVKAAA